MQETRRYILNILRERRDATVDDLVLELRKRRGDSITAVTVRHHLNELLRENLVASPQLRHRSAPGRPQYVYTLTEQAREHFPNNYQPLVTHLLEYLSEQMPARQVNVILEGVADRMAADAAIPDAPLPQRLEAAVAYLNQHGYNACWERDIEGYILRTRHCPYHHISESNHALCEMDMRFVASLLGVVPRLISRLSEGDSDCAYMIPDGQYHTMRD
jgi:predicted ArsR family transcriptional regulator